jgi:hypothetical protein
VNVKADIGANGRQLGKSRHADVDVAADSASLNNGLVGILGEQPSSKVGNIFTLF